MGFGKLGAMGRGFGHLGSLGSVAASVLPPLGAASRTYDFVNGTYTADGSGTTAAAAIVGTPRTFTDEFLGDNWGAKTDPAYTNLYNVDLSTAVTGTIGSGGALPTGWSFISTIGLSIDVTNISATAVRIRCYGTATSSTNMRLLMAGSTTITTLANTAYNIAYKCKQIGTVVGPSFSATGGSPFGKGAQHNNASGTFQSFSFTVGHPIRSTDNVTVPVTCPVTTPTNGLRIQPMFAIFTIPNGATCDFTFEISDIQVTLGTGAMQYLGRGATASADNLTINNLSTLLASPFSAVVTGRLPPDVTTGSLFEIGSGSNRIEVTQSNYSIIMNVVNGGVSTQTTLGPVIPWMRTRVSLTVRSGGAVKACLNGKPVVSCGTAPSLTGMKLGSGTTAPLRGSIEDCTVYNAAANDDDLRTIGSLPSGSLYDDFDRADGAVGTAWTGQTYFQTGTAASAVIVSDRVVTTDSGGASTSAYFLTDMTATPKIGGGSMAWENNVGSASAGLICTPNNTSVSDGTAATGITALSNHFLAATPGLFAGKFDTNVLTDHQWNFASIVTQPKDGVTAYPTVWKLRSSDGMLAVRVWNGETEYFPDENYYNLSGRYFVTESYWSTGGSIGKPIWANWGAEL